MGELKVAPKILATSHSITLFWEKHPAASPEWSYRLLADEMAALSTAKTHFTLDNLPPNESVYLTLQISIGGNPWHTIWQGICHTLLSKHRIDVSQPPYSAIGDGKTLNTMVLQEALDDCGPDDMVYFPAGVYLTKRAQAPYGVFRKKSEFDFYLRKQ